MPPKLSIVPTRAREDDTTSITLAASALTSDDFEAVSGTVEHAADQVDTRPITKPRVEIASRPRADATEPVTPLAQLEARRTRTALWVVAVGLVSGVAVTITMTRSDDPPTAQPAAAPLAIEVPPRPSATEPDQKPASTPTTPSPVSRPAPPRSREAASPAIEPQRREVEPAPDPREVEPPRGVEPPREAKVEPRSKRATKAAKPAKELAPKPDEPEPTWNPKALFLEAP